MRRGHVLPGSSGIIRPAPPMLFRYVTCIAISTTYIEDQKTPALQMIYTLNLLKNCNRQRKLHLEQNQKFAEKLRCTVLDIPSWNKTQIIHQK